MEGDKIVQLKPEDILADDNARYSILQGDIDKTSASIMESGGVLSPIEVEPIPGAKVAPKFRLTSGHIRLASVTQLNKEQNAGLTLSAIVRPLGDPVLRLKHQLAENVERKNLTPMDIAVAIKKLMELGVSRTDIRVMFQRPGGRKGTVMQPASNSFLNMHLSFLNLPKAIQDKIAAGLVSTAAAYELSRVAPDKRQAVLERAEADRLKAVEREEKDDENLAAEEVKVQEMQGKERKAAEALALAEVEAKEAEKLATQKLEAAAAQYKVAKTAPKDATVDEKGNPVPSRKDAESAFKKLEADAKDAEKKAFTAKKNLEKLQSQAKTAAELAGKKQAALAAAKKAAPAASSKKTGRKAIGPTEITQAALKEGASAGTKPLVMSQARDAIRELTLPGGYPKVSAIGAAILKCFDGVTWPKALIDELAVITGEKPASVTPAKAPKARK